MHGGAVGLYEDPEALSLFMLAGPDCTRIVEEFDGINELQSSSTAHHEKEHSLQVKFHKDVRSFINVVEKLCNPSPAKSQELVANSSVPLSNTIKRNNVLTFANWPNTKKKEQKMLACRDRIWPWLHIFSCLSNHALKLTWQIFFRFENHREPPNLADHGTLRSGSKSDILECLNTPNGHAAAAKQVTFVVLDIASVIHMVQPTTTKTFIELAHTANHGHGKAYIQTVDSDVVVLAIHYFETLSLSESIICYNLVLRYDIFKYRTFYLINRCDR